MMTAIAPSDPFLAPDDVDQTRRLVFRGVDWARYQAISKALSGRHVRLTYDRGTLELMTISSEHAYLCSLFAQMVVILAKAVGVRRRSCRDMTWDREDLDRGFEPDECYYLANAKVVQGMMKINPLEVPPPDLGIEVDITSDSRNRLPLYAAMKVPEVWRFKNDSVTFLRLADDGTYRSAEHSGQFPFLTPIAIESVLSRRTEADEETLIDDFEAWVREHCPPK